MKVGNVVVIKLKYKDEIRHSDGSRSFGDKLGTITGVVEDVVTSEIEGKYYFIKGNKYRSDEIVSHKVLLE